MNSKEAFLSRRRTFSCHYFSRAFSLIELLICLAVLGVLLSVSLPSLSSLLARSNTEKLQASYVAIIKLAKQTAINKNVMVTLCKSTDGLQCEGNWENGSIAFIDYNTNAEFDDEDLLLRRIYPNQYINKIYWRSFRNQSYLQITPLGFTNNQSGNFTFCTTDNDLKQTQQIIINRVGRVRLAQDSDNDGYKEDSRGRPLRC